MAGRLKTGIGKREPGVVTGEPLTLRREEARFTSLFGCEGGGVRLSGSMGVVEPEVEKAMEPLECETAAEPGRECEAWLESREVDTLLDRRRSQERGRDAVGVLAGEALSSPSRVPRRSVAMLKPRLSPTLASPADRTFPSCPSLTERAAGGGGAKPKEGELRCRR